MALSFKDLVLSDQFTFLVGEDEQPVTVHTAAIAATSPQLDALMNGGMEESQARCATLKDVQLDDFIRFCEYAYIGDYTAPSCEEEPQPDTSPVPTANQQGPVLVAGSQTQGRQKTKIATGWDREELNMTARGAFLAEFSKRNYRQDGDPRALILQRFVSKTDVTVYQNFTPVFLAHARLYCFAHVRLIAPLAALTLHKLHNTMLKFRWSADRVGDIIELVRFVYCSSDLPDRSTDGALDELKKLVVDYIVYKLDAIGKKEEFVKLIQEGGEFVGDLWMKTTNYVQKA